jgi:hypothetical protein
VRSHSGNRTLLGSGDASVHDVYARVARAGLTFRSEAGRLVSQLLRFSANNVDELQRNEERRGHTRP